MGIVIRVQQGLSVVLTDYLMLVIRLGLSQLTFGQLSWYVMGKVTLVRTALPCCRPGSNGGIPRMSSSEKSCKARFPSSLSKAGLLLFSCRYAVTTMLLLSNVGEGSKAFTLVILPSFSTKNTTLTVPSASFSMAIFG